ncbi:MAG: 3-deoxy-D-manno-octulosonic acid transferase [Flavobacteriales bacterium]|nr:3-deoxy-D-manno-octulosonic acid transferase [Flavobacteriales bacterium]
MPLLYDIGLGLYHTGIRIAAPFVPKAKAWVVGRRGTWQRIEAQRDALRGCLWMHCASVGEFEQGRPVLEALKAQHPELPVLITFYSPSGYEARKDFPLATHAEYLPADSVRNAERLIALVQPKAVLWVKYEFWYHWLTALKRNGVPVFLISAIFRKEQPFFMWYGATHRVMLHCFDRIFVQDEASRELLGSTGVMNVTVSGDTRFDRVAAIVDANEELPIARAFRSGSQKPILIAGSTWPEDERLLRAAGSTNNCRMVVVPHEIDVGHLDRVAQEFPGPTIRWSELEYDFAARALDHGPGPFASTTLLVDRMGYLARLYKYADIAYIGGGFGDGIHSLLEAAAWGKPVIFGPHHHKFAEAKGLIEAGGGFEVRNATELEEVLRRLLGDPIALGNASHAAGKYVRDRVGATQCITAEILPRIA